MAQILHGSAMTTARIRAQIQSSKSTDRHSHGGSGRARTTSPGSKKPSLFQQPRGHYSPGPNILGASMERISEKAFFRPCQPIPVQRGR